MAMETSKCRDQSGTKKIPKRINKAKREKMKRDNLNELFLALATSLELSDQNNGKAFVLIEATRMVKDMITQIECLKKENAALLSESQYVTVEKNELRDENSSLEAEIGELQGEIDSKVSLDLNISPPECRNQGYTEVETGGHVRKPHARYPTPADQWPLKVLEPRPQLGLTVVNLQEARGFT